jgi:hypothetical protein
VAICGQPIPIRDFMWEFCEQGVGIQGQFIGTSGNRFNCGGNEAIYRGRFCTMNDIQGLDKKLRLVCDLDSDVGKPVICLGNNENLMWLRSEQGGTVKDGEVIPLAQAPGTDSTNLFSTLTDIQLPADLNGAVWLFEYNTTTNTQRLLSKFEFDDTRPSYQRYYFPSIRTAADSNGQCTQTLCDCVVKLDYVPLRGDDSEYLLIGHLPAMKEAMNAINKAEHEPDSMKANQIIMAGIAVAVRLLNSEVQHYRGDATTPSINVVSSGVYAEPIPNLI